MAFRLPPFLAQPIPVITDEDDPDRAEIHAFLNAVTQWRARVEAQMGFLNPNYALPGVINQLAINADQATRVARLQALEAQVAAIYTAYATGYGRIAAALAAAPAAPAPAPAPAAVRTKMKLPEAFTGKNAATARHFMNQCSNYITQQRILDDEDRIRWTLQLMEGEASPWRDEVLAGFDEINPPGYCTDWVDFVDHFRARWDDPYEGNKASLRIMTGAIKQTTSVKKYNDMFNEAMNLTPYDGQNGMIIDAYENGLKAAVLNGAMAQRAANPQMTFTELQRLMVRVDETLMRNQNRAPAAIRPQARTTINNPVFNIQPTATTSARTTATPAPTSARGTTPLKVEAARQYTRITPEERENLRRIGGCFRCREPGHMASQCPRFPYHRQIAATDSPAPTYASNNPFANHTPASADTAPASQGF